MLNVGLPGSWDAFWARIDRVIPGDTMKMWYSATSNGNPPAHTGYATSTNSGITWEKRPDPVLSPSLPWDGQASFRPYVIFSQSEYKMWYTGLNSGQYRIGFATSPNGVNWTKRANPVLDADGSGWNANGVQHPSVIEDGTGGFKMWMQGSPGFVFGYSEAINETTWTFPVQVFSEDDIVYYPRVIFNGQLYEMWYSVTNHPDSRFKYATSPDGINWMISRDNPVLRPGPQTWDAGGIIPGDIHFDGSMYHLWYQGLSASRWRSGYAVSPKALSYSIMSKNDSIHVVIRVANAAGLSFAAEMESPDGNPVDTLNLFDDGTHGDSLAADGIFANSWKSPAGGTYYVDLKLKLDTLKFEMNNAGTVVTSPLSFVQYESGIPSKYFLGQNFPNPFNPSTEIQFSLPRKSRVTLTIFDLLGREVATLVSEELSAGSYSTRWDAVGHPSGVYLYRLQSAEFVETKKLLLLR